MTFPASARSIMLAAASLLAGCAGNVSSFPTLAPRPVERSGEAPVGGPIAATALPPAVLARVAGLTAQARQGDEAFGVAARAGCAAIGRGRGAAQGSDGWVAGEQALSAIDAARGPTVAASGELDALVLDQARLAEGAAAPVDLGPVTDAAAAAAALDAAQRDRLAALRSGGCRP